MSLRSCALHAILVFLCGMAAAAPSAPKPALALYAGTWDVTVREAGPTDHRARKARLVLGRLDGSWVETGPSSGRCAGRKFPVTVQRSDKLQLDFTVRRQGMAASCPTLAVKVAPVDADTLVGGVPANEAGHGRSIGHNDHEHHAHDGDGTRPVLEVRMRRVGGTVAER